MKKLTLILTLAVAAVAVVVFVTRHDHSHADHPAAMTTMAPTAAPDAAWLAKAKAEYPLKTCVVSDEEIGGSMGEGIDYVYRQEGRPDRLVRFCCKDCRKDFDKDPAKYLQLIDEAAAKAKHG